MSNPIALQPIHLNDAYLQGPLPFDLYSVDRALLAKAGTRVKPISLALYDHYVFRSCDRSSHDAVVVLSELNDILHRYVHCAENWSSHASDVSELAAIAQDLSTLCHSDADICLSMVAYLSGATRATRHCFASAVVSIMLCIALGWSDRRQTTVAKAALTMNLSLLSFHNDCAKTRQSLSGSQRTDVKRHPALSAEMLARSPGTDLSWITAVDQHHENWDGSGYPLGLERTGISEEARVVRVADEWCALTIHPSGRGKMTPGAALREMELVSRNRLDRKNLVALTRLMGAFPPGTVIRLANRETAIVVGWGRNNDAPTDVLGIISPTGNLMHHCPRRDVTKSGFSIREYTSLDAISQAKLPWHKVWANN